LTISRAGKGQKAWRNPDNAHPLNVNKTLPKRAVPSRTAKDAAGNASVRQTYTRGHHSTAFYQMWAAIGFCSVALQTGA